MLRLLACAWLSAPLLAEAAGEAGASPTGPLRGEFGFLTQFSGITAEEARERVRKMRLFFGVVEFELMDAFASYSKPPLQEQEEWVAPVGDNHIKREIIEAYTSEIEFMGGRSWLAVNAMATDPGDKLLQGPAKVAGQFSIGDKPLMDVVVPDADWAQTIVPDWAKWAKKLGCSGILWSSMGNYNKSADKGADFPGFLQAAQSLVGAWGLGQSAKFVDGFGWDARVPQLKALAFSYWQVWTIPQMEDQFFKEAPAGSVLSLLPGKSKDHAGEDWNRFVKGISPLDVMILRWQKARCNGMAYLAVGDGVRHATGDYFPEAKVMSIENINKVRKSVFGKFTCENGAEPSGGVTGFSATSDVVQDEQELSTTSLQETSLPGPVYVKQIKDPDSTTGRFKIKMAGGPDDLERYRPLFEDTLKNMYAFKDVSFETEDRVLLREARPADSVREFQVVVGCAGRCPQQQVPDEQLRRALQQAVFSQGASDTVQLAHFDLAGVASGQPAAPRRERSMLDLLSRPLWGNEATGAPVPDWVLWCGIPSMMGLFTAGISAWISSTSRRDMVRIDVTRGDVAPGAQRLTTYQHELPEGQCE